MKPTALPIRRALSSVLLPAVLLLSAGACHAGSIQLTPVRINLSDAAKVAVLTVRNTGTESSVMQVTLNKWTLAGQENVYKQSQELVITPVTFHLAPGRQQIVRIGLRGGAPAVNEGAYRLLVEEVPPPAKKSGETGTRLLVRHDLPVFIAPVAAAKPSLDVTVDCAADGARLRFTNIGNVHAQLRNIALDGNPGRQELARWDAMDYLLPEAQKTWGLAQMAPSTAGRNFLVTALTDQGSFTADVKNVCP